MMTVWKYPIALQEESVVHIPVGARSLCARRQHGQMQFWALVDSDAPLRPRKVAMIGTGHTCWCHEWDYVGSIHDDSFVWHIFLEPEGAFPV